MKKLLDEVMAICTRELGYYDPSIAESFMEAMDNGVTVDDFIDGILDAALAQ